MTRRLFRLHFVAVTGVSLIVTMALAMLSIPHRASIVQGETDPRPELGQLVRVVGRQRRFIPRLTGGFLYGDLPAVTRGRAAASSVSPEVIIEAARIEQAANRFPTARARAAAASARLVLGDVDVATAALERLLEDDPHQPAWWSDLAAAYLIRGADQGRQDDLVRALDAAARARALAPRMAEGRFNMALALDQNALADQAQAEWDAYARIEAERGWMTEGRRRQMPNPATDLERWNDARRRLMAVDSELDDGEATQLATAFPQRVRELIDDDMLPSWGEAEDTSRAAAILRRAAQLADALAATGGDGMPAIVCRTLRVAAADATRRARAARGVALYGNGRALFARANHEHALTTLNLAERELRAAGTPFWAWAAAYGAASQRALHQWQAALDRATLVARFAETNGFSSLQARTSWTSALALSDLGEPLRASRLIGESIDGFLRSREDENAGAVASAGADLARTIGDRRLSWTLLARALDTAPIERAPVRRYLRYYNASLFARRDQLPYAAMVFQNQAVEAARACAETGALGQALTQRAAIRLALGQKDEAASDLRSARNGRSAAGHGQRSGSSAASARPRGRHPRSGFSDTPA
jgi:tetratricopeptide (TPR) repeat protein